jgi:uncharacterized membrane protein
MTLAARLCSRPAAFVLMRLFAAPILCVGSAHADVIKCYFTEPFLTLTYSTTESSLAVSDPEAEATERNVSLQIMGAGAFELWNAQNIAVLRLTLDNKGSDGMSDRIYPYSAMRLPSAQYGGCTSNHLAAKEPSAN